MKENRIKRFNENSELNISDVIQRLSNLDRVQIYGFGGVDENYPNSPDIEKDIKQTNGRYVKYEDIKKLIGELKNVV
jgi:hypothetical protein